MSTNHVKFDDDQDAPSTTKGNKISMDEVELHSTKKRVLNMDDSESDSEDDAPEEEGAASTKADIEKKLQINEEAKKLEQQQLKEKRRKQNAIFEEQQSAKKQKISEKKEEKETDDVEVAEPLEELPAELLALDEDIKTSKNTHINFDNEDNNEYDDVDSDTERSIRNNSLKNKRKNQLKDLRRKTSQNGPVSLRILASSTQSRSMAPRKEVQITSTKDKWLRRRTLNRK